MRAVYVRCRCDGKPRVRDAIAGNDDRASRGVHRVEEADIHTVLDAVTMTP